MLLVMKGYSDINISELFSIYSQTIHQISVDYFHGTDFNQMVLADDRFLEDLQDFFRIPGAKLFVWRIDGKCVSALRSEPYLNGELITHLETDPEQRGKGYAGELLFSVIQYLQKLGVREIFSHVSKQNAPSIAVHRLNGFYVKKDCARLLDGTVSQNYYTLQYDSTAE